MFTQLYGISRQNNDFAFVSTLEGACAGFFQTLVLGHSLRRWAPQVTRVLLISEHYRSEQLESLGLFWDRIIFVNGRFSGAKTEVVQQVAALGLLEYSKILLVGNDFLACGNVLDVFALPAPAASFGGILAWTSGEQIALEARRQIMAGCYLLEPSEILLHQGLALLNPFISFPAVFAELLSQQDVFSLSLEFNYRSEFDLGGVGVVCGVTTLERHPHLVHFAGELKPWRVLYDLEELCIQLPEAHFLQHLAQNDNLLNARFKSVSSSGTRNRFISMYRLWLVHASQVCERVASYVGLNLLDICTPFGSGTPSFCSSVWRAT